MRTAVFCVGSQVPPQVDRLLQGVRLLAERSGGRLVSGSDIFADKHHKSPWGIYVNAGVCIQIDREDQDLEAIAKEVESLCGRTRSDEELEKITLDIDLLGWVDDGGFTPVTRRDLGRPHVFHSLWCMKALPGVEAHVAAIAAERDFAPARNALAFSSLMAWPA